MDESFVDIAWLATLATCLKILLIPSYRSTDFEVHRHWLATTRSLPLSQWYVDTTSEWTLDYPPLFAWFERALSVPAAWVDPAMVDVYAGLNYASPATVIFQRGTVMASDCILYYATWRFCRGLEAKRRRAVLAAVLLAPGLLMVDHIHFQYNGALLGLLLLSLCLLKEGQNLAAGILFAILVCSKHLFAVAGPWYFVYLLRRHCWGPGWLPRLLLLGSSVVAVFLASFGPFLHLGQLTQVMTRLFPFGRGLCHAYWAPNMWTLYNVADKALVVMLRLLGSQLPEHKAAFTQGLVGDASPHVVLPPITPAVSLSLVLLTMVPCLVATWRRPEPQEAVKAVAHMFLCSFMFGWHVHEKAALHFVIPLALVCTQNRRESTDFLFISTVVSYSLFPLLFGAQEYPIKVLLLLLYTIGLSTGLLHTGVGCSVMKPTDDGVETKQEELCHSVHEDFVEADLQLEQSRNFLETLYLYGLLVVEIYVQLAHTIIFGEKFPFLPLLTISTYCSIGMLYTWAMQLYYYSCKAFLKTK